MKHLGIPATSIYSEHIFSKTEKIVLKEKHRTK